MHKNYIHFFPITPLHPVRFSDIIVENEVINMRDFPIFTTDYGVSSLVLKEIPYKKQAFIYIRDVQEGHLEEHLAECISFCRMAGAEFVYAAGWDALHTFPLYTQVWEMRCTAVSDQAHTASLFPVTEETVARWRGIYNDRMAGVDNAATLEARDEKRILDSGTYFVHRDGQLLGIGWMDDTSLLAMASTVPGEGRTVLSALLSLAEGETVTLEVASTNIRAIRLYEDFGFLKTKELSRWYRVG